MNCIAMLKTEWQPKPCRTQQAFPTLYLRDVGGVTGHIRSIKQSQSFPKPRRGLISLLIYKLRSARYYQEAQDIITERSVLSLCEMKGQPHITSRLITMVLYFTIHRCKDR